MADSYDVVVVGAGNAGLCAALAAREQGASVLVLEKAPREQRGGNTYFTGGAFRFPYGGLADIRRLVPDMSDAEAEKLDFGSYPGAQFYDDLMRVSEGKADGELTEVLVKQAYPTMLWMREKGIRWVPLYGRQAFEREGVRRFWGGLVLEAVGGGPGLSDRQFELAEQAGVQVRYDTGLCGLATGNRAVGAQGLAPLPETSGAARPEESKDERSTRHLPAEALEGRAEHARRVTGVRIQTAVGEKHIPCRAVVLACGGFEANAEMRAQHLGRDWEQVPVRGTEFNTGDGIRAALDAGAAPAGDWCGAHAVAWDLNAPPVGNRRIGDLYQKHSYPLGIVVNARGERFLDEGADFRNYTYARYGREILRQPERAAFQIFDSKVLHLLRDEYRIPGATKAESDTVGGLAEVLGIDREGLERTVAAFNAAVQPGEFDPARLDGLRTEGIEPPKSNWALPLDTPPYAGYAVTCGITFTFGGLRVDREARVLDTDGHVISGLYAAGELVGGLFWGNYAGGSGLTAGSLFGRIAGQNAAGGIRAPTGHSL